MLQPVVWGPKIFVLGSVVSSESRADQPEDRRSFKQSVPDWCCYSCADSGCIDGIGQMVGVQPIDRIVKLDAELVDGDGDLTD